MNAIEHDGTRIIERREGNGSRFITIQTKRGDQMEFTGEDWSNVVKMVMVIEGLRGKG